MILKTFLPRLFKALTLCILLLESVAIPINRAYGGGKTRIFPDMLGNRVEVQEPLTRVALLGGPTGQIAYILGARNQLCAVTKSLKSSELINLMDPTVKNLAAPRTTSGQVNVEELILSDPQLVIAGDLDASVVEKKTRIPVARLKSTMNQSFNLLKEEVRFYGKAFGKEARAEIYVQYLQKTLDRVQTRIQGIPKEKRKKVFNGYSASHLVTLGGDTFMQQHMNAAGCLNAAESILTTGSREGGLHTGLAEVSMEKVLEWNPDIMIIDFGTPAELYANPKWKSIKAVQNKMVFRQPIGVFIWDRPTAESAVLHPLWLAKIAYPERFADINMIQEIKQFYRQTMSFNLSDAQANAILTAQFGISFFQEGKKPGK